MSDVLVSLCACLNQELIINIRYGTLSLDVVKAPR